MYTIRHYKRDFANLTVAIVGDVLHSRVARSDINALTTLGCAEVRVVGPKTLVPSDMAQMGVRVNAVLPGITETRFTTALVEDERLPFPDALFDRIIVCHALEEAESPNRLLREIWRVAAPEARILIIVAHRRGLWARAESTPFGHGRPYTRTQLTRLLEDAMSVKHLNQIDLARRWSISPRTLERWRWIGQGPRYIKIGGRVIYRVEEVEAFEAQQTRGSTSDIPEAPALMSSA